MALPPPIRGFRSKHINALLNECRANTPLPGFGVRVRRTPSGTFIDAEGGGDGADPVPVAWTVREGEGVTDEATGETKQTWEVFAPAAAIAGQELAPENMAATGWNTLPDDVTSGDLWAVYYGPNDKNEDTGASNGPKIKLTTTQDEKRLSVHIGTFTTDTEANVKSWEQIHVGIIVPDGGEAAPPVAWTVRKKDGGGWEIFSPLWVLKVGEQVVKGGTSGEWVDIPKDLTGGTLYAVMTITVAAATYEQTAWELTMAKDAESLEDTPLVPPSPPTNPGQDGVYHLIVPIGQFSPVDTGSETSEQDFTQWHVGVISEDFNPRRTLEAQTVVEAVTLSDDGKKLRLHRKTIMTPLPRGEEPTPNPEELELNVSGEADHSERWGRVLIRALGTGDAAQEGANVGDLCLWQFREFWDVERKAYVEAETPVFVGKLPGGGLPDGLVIPGGVEVKTNTNILQQRYLKWDAAQGAFVDTDAPDIVAYLNVSYGPFEWVAANGAYKLVRYVGYFTPTLPNANWQRGGYTDQDELPTVSFAAAHAPDLL